MEFKTLTGTNVRAEGRKDVNSQLMYRSSIRDCAVEAIGTFFLLFAIASPNATPLAVGSALMVMVYAGGHLSGAHYNPAITVAVQLAKHATRPRLGASTTIAGVVVYMLSQMTGAVLGVLAADAVHDTASGDCRFQPREGATTINILLAEMLATFALCYVVLQTAVHKDNGSKSFYGLSIGFTVLSMAHAVGSVSGGAFNPAVATAFVLVDGSSCSTLWHYWLAPTLGGILASMAFVYLAPSHK